MELRAEVSVETGICTLLMPGIGTLTVLGANDVMRLDAMLVSPLS